MRAHSPPAKLLHLFLPFFLTTACCATTAGIIASGTFIRNTAARLRGGRAGIRCRLLHIPQPMPVLNVRLVSTLAVATQQPSAYASDFLDSLPDDVADQV